MSSFTSIDFAIMGIVFISVLMGIWRGLFRELMAIAVWVVALMIAILYAPTLSATFQALSPQAAVRLWVAFLVVFMAAYLIGMMLRFWFLKLLPQEVSLSGRFLGGLFGLIRGVLFVLILGFLAAYTTLTAQPIWQYSKLTTTVEHMDAWIADAIPENAGDVLLHLFGKTPQKNTPTQTVNPNDAI